VGSPEKKRRQRNVGGNHGIPNSRYCQARLSYRFLVGGAEGDATPAKSPLVLFGIRGSCRITVVTLPACMASNRSLRVPILTHFDLVFTKSSIILSIVK
jgi:hypothetical protein